MPELNPPNEPALENNIAPNQDAELDAALSKSFANMRSQSESDNKGKDTTPPPEPKKEVKPAEPAREISPEEGKKPIVVEDKSLPDPEQIEQAPPGKPSSQSKDGWNALRNNYKKAHRITQEKDAEITKLKATLAEKSSLAQKELDAVKTQMSELEKYRAMVDIQADPEFVSKYDQPIEKSVTGIKGMLQEMGVSNAVVDQIDFNNTKLLEEIVGHVSKSKDEFVARKLKRKIEDYLDLSDKRNETLEEQKKNYKELLEQKKKDSYTKGAESEGRMIKHLELKSQEKDKDGKPLIPFLSPMQPKENATQAEIDQANNHNTMVEAMNKKLQGVLKMREPEQQAEIAIAAVASHYLMSQVRALNQELNNAREELKKMSVVTTETPTRKPAAARNGNQELVDTDTALGSYFGRNR